MDKIEFNTAIIGCQYIYLPQCHSTNDYALNLIKSSSPSEGCLINTSYQTNGRGQRGNSWQTEIDKNLTFSCILRPSFLPITDQFLLCMAVSLALIDTLKEYIPKSHLKIKWPNDIYVSYESKWRKIGGVLIENILNSVEISASVVGIGLNVNQQSFESSTAISIRTLTNIDTSLQDLLIIIAKNLELNYSLLKEGKGDKIKHAYTKLLYAYGEKHRFEVNREILTGIILGVRDDGALAVEIDNQIKNFNIQEIKFVFS